MIENCYFRTGPASHELPTSLASSLSLRRTSRRADELFISRFFRFFDKEIMKMGILEDMNQRAKRFSLIDIKLAQMAAAFSALIIAKLIPQIMDLSIWWFVGLLVICAIKPFYEFWK